MDLIHQATTQDIIGVYYAIYNKLSQTYPEFIYERAMMALLKKRGLKCVRQDEYEISYKDKIVGLQRLDLFIADKVVVELKVAAQIKALHLAQLLSYLKVTGKEVGLLLRFGGPDPEFARRILTSPTQFALDETDVPPTPNDDWLYPALAQEIIGGAFEVFRTLGPGFMHRIYANACYHEFKLRGLEVRPRREFNVFLDGFDLGSIKLGHLQIEDKVLVFPVAVSDLENIKLANLKAWMRHLSIPLGIVVNFNAAQFKPLVLRI
jgi:GxxExxY protein